MKIEYVGYFPEVSPKTVLEHLEPYGLLDWKYYQCLWYFSIEKRIANKHNFCRGIIMETDTRKLNERKT